MTWPPNGVRECTRISRKDLKILELRASPRVWYLSLAYFFLANEEKIASNNLAINLAFLATWQIEPLPRAYMRARKQLGIAVLASLRFTVFFSAVDQVYAGGVLAAATTALGARS